MEANNVKAMRDALEELVANIEMRSSTYGNDYFIVNVGAFEIRFELAKLGKPKEEGGAK